ncbi:AGC protein kinase, variant 1 [Aphanomyces invadans]|nr:AGC protein kinase, variant 1 [Aphanomyces invadans]ETV93065.1 AGC protein kinase, variant 1 [Aphanomyces invadans]|eukprot:XP_008878329.1 AGC protein kinase, variant 1 [Aphanomyces invadans]
MDALPFFIQHLSQDIELKFNFDPFDAAKYAFCHGVYYAREGFVHFVSLFRQCFALVESATNAPTLTSKDPDIIELVGGQLITRLSSKESIPGRLHVRFNFSPSGRISRLSVYFKQDKSQAPVPTSRGRSRTLYTLESHPQNFHLCYKTKRSLLLSFRDLSILGVLGQGGFGTVVLVQRKSLHDEELFAIKVVEKSQGSASALKERRILSTLRHPFLARLRFAFQTQSKLFLGLDFYTGGNLYYHMHAATMSDGTCVETSGGKRLAIERARFYAAELALAFAYLHTHGIIYRDLKPDNIMLDQEGHIRLVDFGISKQLFQEESTGTLAGSPAYIAPEQLSTQNPTYGYAADWWSWGVMLYEMLYGSTPFHDHNVSVMYRKITEADVIYANHFNLDSDAVDLLQHVLVRDPSTRLTFAQIQAHPFFATIDWVLLLQKQVPPPYVPLSRDVFDHVSQHFRKMNVNSLDDTPCIGVPPPSKGGVAAHDHHFDEFSFCYERRGVRDEAYNLMIQVKETFSSDDRPPIPTLLEHQTSEDLHDDDDGTDMDPEVNLVISEISDFAHDDVESSEEVDES